MTKENREYKDSVFVDLFYNDETAKKNLLSLYNALHDTDLADESLIKKIKIEDILYKNIHNDISCQVGDEIFVFGEHQSTINPNIPVRYVLYAGRAYEQILDKRDRYRTRLVKIPTPEFYVFYNGRRDYPVQQTLSLSDAFMRTPKDNSMELKVTVININTDRSHEILDKCTVLREYSQFIDTVRSYSGKKDPIKNAIEDCIDRGILIEYLKRKGSEVRNMLVAEYSYEEDIEVKQEEAKQEGVSQGIEQEKSATVQRMLKMGLFDLEVIAQAVGLTIDEVTDIRDKMEPVC